MALVTMANTERTMCQRNTSRWSMKVISESSPIPLLSLLKNDPCSDTADFFGKAKVQKRGI
jgi:hypothetical protein